MFHFLYLDIVQYAWREEVLCVGTVGVVKMFSLHTFNTEVIRHLFLYADRSNMVLLHLLLALQTAAEKQKFKYNETVFV